MWDVHRPLDARLLFVVPKAGATRSPQTAINQRGTRPAAAHVGKNTFESVEICHRPFLGQWFFVRAQQVVAGNSLLRRQRRPQPSINHENTRWPPLEPKKRPPQITHKKKMNMENSDFFSRLCWLVRLVKREKYGWENWFEWELIHSVPKGG